MAIYYNNSYYEGDYLSQGGLGKAKEGGAAGTVFLKSMYTDIKELKVYNQKTTGVGDQRLCVVKRNYRMSQNKSFLCGNLQNL